MDPTLTNLGPQVKALRRDLGLTLQQVSERSGVSVSTLSKIENGRISGTVNTMLKVARGLGVLFDRLLEHSEQERQPTARLVQTKAAGVKAFPTDFYDYYVHSSDLLGRRMLPLVITVKTREVPPRLDWSTHAGEEFLLVIEGQIQLHTEHYAPITLDAGDSVYFDSLMRHAYVSVGEQDARVISVSLAQLGEQTAMATQLQRSMASHEPSPSGSAVHAASGVGVDAPD